MEALHIQKNNKPSQAQMNQIRMNWLMENESLWISVKNSYDPILWNLARKMKYAGLYSPSTSINDINIFKLIQRIRLNGCLKFQ